MSSLKVLFLGNHPNVIFYTSRLQLAKNVELYNVYDSDITDFQLETQKYGKLNLQIKNHFKTVSDLLIKYNNQNLIFDIVILSPCWVYDFQKNSNQLQHLVNTNTKIIIESTGYVSLESTIKPYLDPSTTVFSIISSYDIRYNKSNNSFKEYSLKNKDANNIYLGTIGITSEGSLLTSYHERSETLLLSLQRLFKKLLAKDTIELCSLSPSEYLSKKWFYALQRICFDSAMIFFNISDPYKLQPLLNENKSINGIYDELISLVGKMGLKEKFSRDVMHNLWKSNFINKINNLTAPLVHNFMSQIYLSDIELTLSQPRALAKLFSVECPRLEFLHFTISQMIKMNQGESTLFERSNINNEGNIQLLKTHARLKKEFDELQASLDEKNFSIIQIKNDSKKVTQYTFTLNKEANILQNQLDELSARQLETSNNKVKNLRFSETPDIYNEINDNNRITKIPSGRGTPSTSIMKNGYNPNDGNSNLMRQQKQQDIEFQRRSKMGKSKQFEFQQQQQQQQQQQRSNYPQYHAPSPSMSEQYFTQQPDSNNHYYDRRGSLADSVQTGNNNYQNNGHRLIRPTSRKNRTSDFADIRRTSSIEAETFRNSLTMSMSIDSGLNNSYLQRPHSRTPSNYSEIPENISRTSSIIDGSGMSGRYPPVMESSRTPTNPMKRFSTNDIPQNHHLQQQQQQQQQKPITNENLTLFNTLSNAKMNGNSRIQQQNKNRHTIQLSTNQTYLTPLDTQKRGTILSETSIESANISTFDPKPISPATSSATDELSPELTSNSKTKKSQFSSFFSRKSKKKQ
ncbi:hypothetical protein Kpol_1031p71 [Vanderwaltozyma polyspora DSM 70294]|uniref:Ketopantoate reductase C-terminal domain-containing protein n=1 Tax=Vanderwaltozyma polyspora (strain ATCC 22028 / DSM 70294 / BCRC 21397 / CBS 2163 / NBRC 10782 / NRRL Y-8283 / UCD 57-17) TaxID=436907 RepID=A7TI02_VANPO|nr:uncharacterized protein Kpol_1031p71 [Vanderwaltozyma polyspora DSM 70294]EDO18164.1 hypothetical protein Kpol_1031p71 [Vanderwaltozyma polyspora DSM 70294]